jgi:Spherulation-specific family 4
MIAAGHRTSRRWAGLVTALCLISLGLTFTPTGARAAHAAAAQTLPGGCWEANDSNGTGFPLLDAGHNVQAYTERVTRTCFDYVNADTISGVQWFEVEDEDDGLCMNDAASDQVRFESCSVGDGNELVRFTGTNQVEFRTDSMYMTAASISSGALVSVSSSSTPDAENEWLWTLPIMHDLTVMYPAYPGYNSPNWTTIEDSEPYGAVQDVVLEICAPDGTCGGAADEPNPNWPATLSALNNAGVEPLYYIDTDYDADSLASVEAAVARAEKWYGIGSGSDEINPGFFFDRVSTDDASYYQALYNYVETNYGAPVVMFNPGTPPATSYYFGPQEILNVYEGSEADFSSAKMPSWMNSYPPAIFSAVVSAGTAGNLEKDIDTALDDGIDNLYVDDEAEPSPDYSTLPSFYSQENDDIAVDGGYPNSLAG